MDKAGSRTSGRVISRVERRVMDDLVLYAWENRFWLGLVIGMFTGAGLGILIMCLCIVSGKGEGIE
jgi:hypothetical protein